MSKIMSKNDGQKTNKCSPLIDSVDDGFNYFNDFRLEELKSDDKYYIKSFMDYIQYLESRTQILSNMSKEENLRHEVKFQLDCFREGKIQKEDFFQAMDEILYGKVKPPVRELDNL